MADDIDLAHERIELESQARLRYAPKFDGPSLNECQDCGEDIPLKRQLLGSITRCFDCQNHVERRR